jgi:hypothetical protein
MSTLPRVWMSPMAWRNNVRTRSRFFFGKEKVEPVLALDFFQGITGNRFQVGVETDYASPRVEYQYDGLGGFNQAFGEIALAAQHLLRMFALRDQCGDQDARQQGNHHVCPEQRQAEMGVAGQIEGAAAGGCSPGAHQR